MKKIFILLCCLPIIVPSWSHPIDRTQAQTIAHATLQSHGVTTFFPVSPSQCQIHRGAQSGAADFYVFNNGDNGGFVIVSADDRTYSVLGYSTVGHLDLDHIPEALADMLTGYGEQIRYARSLPTDVSPSTAETSHYEAVSPLLGDIAWDQTWPYNLMTPCYVGTTHSATGCVATAMAQIMYYHRWPVQGQGSHSYIPYGSYSEVSTDFSAHHYDWDAMTPTYDSNSSEESCNAVAQLMFDCGVAVDMVYGESSGSTIDYWPSSLIRYFGYDGHLGQLHRNFYTQEDWDGIIRSEIAAGRPVFSTGFTESSGGHAYVFDGYDSDGLIHVNWGWSGMSNGYFRMSALTPPTQGTGGSAGGFNYRQGIIVGIQKPNATAEDWLEIVSSEKSKAKALQGQIADGPQVRLTGKITNYGWRADTVDLGFMVCDSNGLQKINTAVKENVALDTNSYVIGIPYTTLDLSSLTDGNYRIYPSTRNAGGQQWSRIRDYSYQKPNWLKLTVSNGEWSIASPEGFNLTASIDSMTPIYQNINAQLKATLRNSGDMSYSGSVYAALLNPTDGVVTAKGDEYKFEVSGGDSTEVVMTPAFSASPGTYNLVLLDENSQQLNTPIAVEVKAAPTVSEELRMSRQLSFDDNDHVNPDSLALTAGLECVSGVFAKDVSIYIYNSEETQVVSSFNPQFVFLEEGQQKDVNFKGNFENAVEGQTYVARLINLTNSTYLEPMDMATCRFTIATADAIREIATTDAPTDVFDLSGRKVGNTATLKDLPRGLYIVKGKKILVR
ncbi:MAG: C10 family peptidase [Prevotella sp.]|jgi:hypothetical protein